MKKDKLIRCPWCGMEFKPQSYNVKCIYCKNKIKPYYNIYCMILMVLISILAATTMFAYRNIIVFLVLLASSYVFKNIILLHVPYKIDSDKYVYKKRQEANIELYQKSINNAIKHIIISENRIFTICFISKDNVPISHMICVATESIHWNKEQKGLKCIFAYLPLGKLDKEYTEETKFYLFYNNKKIGEGFLGKMLEGFNNYL